MKFHLQKNTPFFMLTLAAVVFFCSMPSVAWAYKLELAGSSLFENMLNADPGEDPHLKTEPGITVWCLSEGQGQSGLLVSSGNHQNMLTSKGAESDVIVPLHTRLKNRCRMIFRQVTLTESR